MVRYLVWRVDEEQNPGARHDYEIVALIEPVYSDITLHSQALVYAGTNGEAPLAGRETVEIAVQHKGAYLKYLPALYEQDDFIGRFLMLFESFWQPIESQVGNIYDYFDPRVTPARFLPWLASWFNLLLDDYWTEAQQRRLLSSIIHLYRRHGTRRPCKNI